jgi:hypothetical protein
VVERLQSPEERFCFDDDQETASKMPMFGWNRHGKSRLDCKQKKKNKTKQNKISRTRTAQEGGIYERI